MMYQQVIARRYAKGLMLSLKVDDFDLVLEDLKSFADLFSFSCPEFKRVFEDPAFSPLDRRAIIEKIAMRADIRSELRHFLLLLIEKNRMTLLPFIYEALLALIDVEKERLRVKIVSASAVDKEDILEITTLLEKSLRKKILPETLVDPSLLGGMRVEVAGTIYDGSLKAKLAAIRHELTSGQ